MKDNLVSAMRRCFVPALFSLFALALTARGDDLLDAVLNAPPAPAPAETVEKPVVSKPVVSKDEPPEPDGKGEMPLFRFDREDADDNVSVTWLTGYQVAATSATRGERARDGRGSRYSSGDNLGVSAQLEFRAPLSNWLSLDARVLYLYETHESDHLYGTHESDHKYYRRYWHESGTWKTMLGDASLCVNPWRGKVFDPFIGIGLRHARSEMEYEFEKNGREESYDWDDSKTSILLRIGVQLNAGRFSLKAEYLFFDDGEDDDDIGPKGEAVGSLGFFVTPIFQLLLFSDNFIRKNENSNCCHVGGGLSLNF